MFRGLFFALVDDELDLLRAARGDVSRRRVLAEWEERWPDERRQDTDKAWYPLSLMLGSKAPLGLLFRTGQQMHRGNRMIMNLIVREQVKPIATALHRYEREQLRRKYDKLSDDDFYPGELKRTTAQFRYVMLWFTRIRRFVDRHHANHLLFTSDWA